MQLVAEYAFLRKKIFWFLKSRLGLKPPIIKSPYTAVSLTSMCRVNDEDYDMRGLTQ